MHRPDSPHTWITSFNKSPNPKFRLFCLHPAGGASASFRKWMHAFPSDIDVCGIDLPGRADEGPRLTSMAQVVEALLPLIVERADVPYGFFGWSLGGAIAATLVKTLEQAGLPAPSVLILGAVNPPQWWAENDTAFRTSSDQCIIDMMTEMGGTSSKVLSDPTACAKLIERLRSDIAILETWRPASFALGVPLHVIGGTADTFVRPADIVGWQHVARGMFQLSLLRGKHFVVFSDREQVLHIVKSAMAPHVPNAIATGNISTAAPEARQTQHRPAPPTTTELIIAT